MAARPAKTRAAPKRAARRAIVRKNDGGDIQTLPVCRKLVCSAAFPLIYQNVICFNGTYTETTAGGHTDVVIRGNNPFDPYYAAGGEEATAIDELVALYDHARVLSSEICVTAQNQDASHAVTCIVVPSLVATALSNASATPALPYARAVGVQHPTQKTLRHSMSTMLMAGRKRGTGMDDDWVCLAGSAPTREWYWHIVFNGAIGVAALDLRYSVTMRFTIEWYGLKYLSQT